MKNTTQSTLSEHIAYNETKVECPNCHATMIVKVADLKSDKLPRCLVCRTPINDLLERDYTQAEKNIQDIGE